VSCKIGSLLRIRGKTTILHAKASIPELGLGSLKVTLFMSGNRVALSSGFMENVCLFLSPAEIVTYTSNIAAGSGKSVLRHVKLSGLLVRKI
jgi:hypothetical protein